MKYHELKIEERFFEGIVNNTKTFEIRKNDRNYEIGDIIHFTITDSTNDEMNKKADDLLLKIVGILKDSDFPQGIKEGYCIISFKKGSSTFKADK